MSNKSEREKFDWRKHREDYKDDDSVWNFCTTEGDVRKLSQYLEKVEIEGKIQLLDRLIAAIDDDVDRDHPAVKSLRKALADVRGFYTA